MKVTPLHISCMLGHITGVTLLLEAGADIEAVTDAGRTTRRKRKRRRRRRSRRKRSRRTRRRRRRRRGLSKDFKMRALLGDLPTNK